MRVFRSPLGPPAAAQVGTVRGEDYDFQFSGRVREGRLHFRLNMEYVGDDEDAGERPPDPPPDHRRGPPLNPVKCRMVDEVQMPSPLRNVQHVTPFHHMRP